LLALRLGIIWLFGRLGLGLQQRLLRDSTGSHAGDATGVPGPTDRSEHACGYGSGHDTANFNRSPNIRPIEQ